MKQFYQIICVVLAAFLVAFNGKEKSPSIQGTKVVCSEKGCRGFYAGPEFVFEDDIAHQFSNTMSAKVGDELKVLYRSHNYVKVDMPKIRMSTKGMGSGYVTYKLVIPFVSVTEKCEAFTSFDHVGGWNHSPALSSRKKQLNKTLLPGEKLDVSALKITPEGLQEYWIQWKNKVVQSDCVE